MVLLALSRAAVLHSPDWATIVRELKRNFTRKVVAGMEGVPPMTAHQAAGTYPSNHIDGHEDRIAGWVNEEIERRKAKKAKRTAARAGGGVASAAGSPRQYSSTAAPRATGIGGARRHASSSSRAAPPPDDADPAEALAVGLGRLRVEPTDEASPCTSIGAAIRAQGHV